jgi:hypothetical protein
MPGRFFVGRWCGRASATGRGVSAGGGACRPLAVLAGVSVGSGRAFCVGALAGSGVDRWGARQLRCWL